MFDTNEPIFALKIKFNGLVFNILRKLKESINMLNLDHGKYLALYNCYLELRLDRTSHRIIKTTGVDR